MLASICSFFFSSRRRHTRWNCDWSSDVCSSDLKRFDFVRIVPISRGANSSSGGLPEKWGVAYHSTPQMVAVNAASREYIQYADLGEILKMLDVKTGGALQDPVNLAQSLVRPPEPPSS